MDQRLWTSLSYIFIFEASLNGDFPISYITKWQAQVIECYKADSRVDTDVLMEVAYSCNFLAVSDSSTCPDIGTSWCHAGIIEHFEIRGFKMTP